MSPLHDEREVSFPDFILACLHHTDECRVSFPDACLHYNVGELVSFLDSNDYESLGGIIGTELPQYFARTYFCKFCEQAFGHKKQ